MGSKEPGGGGEIDGLPVGVVEGGLGPEGLVGGGVDGRVADGELPGAVEREDGLAEGDVRDAVGRLDARRGRVRGDRLRRFRFGGLSDGGKAEKRHQQDRKRLRNIPIKHVRVTSRMRSILIRTIADYPLRATFVYRRNGQMARQIPRRNLCALRVLCGEIFFAFFASLR